MAEAHDNRKKPECTRSIGAGTLGFSAHAGIDEMRFDGVISRRERLGAGSYMLVMVATASGERSTPRTLRFTIAKGSRPSA